MEDQSSSEAQQELGQLEDCNSSSPQQQHEHTPSSTVTPTTPNPSSLTTPTSFSPSAVTDTSSSPDCEQKVNVPDSQSHAEAQAPMDVSPADQRPQTDTIGPAVLMEATGDTVDTGQDVPHTVMDDGGNVEESGKVEAGGEDGEVLEQEVLEITTEMEMEENGSGLDFINVAMLDDMAKRIQVEEITPAAGLVSILKRRVSLEGENSSAPAAPKPVSKRKVRFREPDEGLDHDEVGGDSWLLLLLLCLATVVISVGGTALYCTFGDTQSSVCTDFSHNMDFYVGRVQRGMDELKHWLSPSS
ncbi:consortin-like [Danio aesculapii]|uniref:consortin-like n=1 Tax=Danio aesculapii TaxID=1142201 RepID=UPI0024C08AFB|nr:consortin-like [Danio aesculapii]